MNHMKCLKNNAGNVGKAIEILKAGGVVAHPADTCYGLAGDLMNVEALNKLRQIKGREADKPMSIMLPVYLKPKLGDYGLLNEFAEMVCEKLLPGPVTIVLPKGPKIPDYFFTELPTIGIRIPYDAKTDELLTGFKGPIITTSANLAGQPVCASCEDLVSLFENRTPAPDLFLDGEINGAGLPSTVISLEDDQVTILRPGPMEKEQLEAILGVEIQ